MKGPKSGLDEDEEDARVSVPPSARASSAGVGESERTSMGLVVLSPISPVVPSLALRTWGCEGGPKVGQSDPGSSSRLLLRGGAALGAGSSRRPRFVLALPSTSAQQGSGLP
jgi:hypothetical protein